MEYLTLNTQEEIELALKDFRFDENNWESSLELLGKALEPFVLEFKNQIYIDGNIENNIKKLVQELTPIFESKFPGYGEAVIALILSDITLNSETFQALKTVDLESQAILASFDPVTISAGVASMIIMTLLYRSSPNAPSGLKKILSTTLAMILSLTVILNSIGASNTDISTDVSITNKVNQFNTYILPRLNNRILSGEDTSVNEYRQNISDLIQNNSDLHFLSEASKKRYDYLLGLLINLSNKISSLSADNKGDQILDENEEDDIRSTIQNLNSLYLNELKGLNSNEIKNRLFFALNNNRTLPDSSELKKIFEDNEDIKNLFIGYIAEYFSTINSNNIDSDQPILIDDPTIIAQFFKDTFSQYSNVSEIIRATKDLSIKHNISFKAAFNITKIGMRIISSNTDLIPGYVPDDPKFQALANPDFESTYNLVDYFNTKYNLKTNDSIDLVNYIVFKLPVFQDDTIKSYGDSLMADYLSVKDRYTSQNIDPVIFIETNNDINNFVSFSPFSSTLDSIYKSRLNELLNNGETESKLDFAVYLSKARQYFRSLGFDDTQIDYKSIYSNYLLTVDKENRSIDDFQNYINWYISLHYQVETELPLLTIKDQNELITYISLSGVYGNPQRDSIVSSFFVNLSNISQTNSQHIFIIMDLFDEIANEAKSISTDSSYALSKISISSFMIISNLTRTDSLISQYIPSDSTGNYDKSSLKSLLHNTINVDVSMPQI